MIRYQPVVSFVGFEIERMIFLVSAPNEFSVRRDCLGPNQWKAFAARTIGELIFVPIANQRPGAHAISPVGKSMRHACQASTRVCCIALRGSSQGCDGSEGSRTAPGSLSMQQSGMDG